jgi:Domain of unknown function (DUF4286)
MIIYSVTQSVDPEIHTQWLDYMLTKHVPDVIDTGLFESYKVLRLLNEEDEGITYNFQYRMKNLADYEAYIAIYAPALRADVNARFEGKLATFRTILEVVAEGEKG